MSLQREMHGHELKKFSRDGEDLVVVWNVQIFTEYETVRYPFSYGGIESPPSTLGELNVQGKGFKSRIAWDQNLLIPSSEGCELSSTPKQVCLSSVSFSVPSSAIQASIGNVNRTRERRRVHFGEEKIMTIPPLSGLNSRKRAEPCDLSDKAPTNYAQDETSRHDYGSTVGVIESRCLRAKKRKTIVMQNPGNEDIIDLTGLRRPSDATQQSIEQLDEPDGCDKNIVEKEDMSMCPSSDSEEERCLAPGRNASSSEGENREDSTDDSDPSVDESQCEAVLPLQKRRYFYRTRTKAVPKGPSNLRERRRKNSQRLDNPFLTRSGACCSLRCFATIEPVHAFKEYKKFMAANRKGFKEALISLYDRNEDCFKFQQQRVCSRFLTRGFGFSPGLQCSVKNTAKSTSSPASIAMPREIRRDTMRDIIARFLRNLAEELGDVMPHRNYTNIPETTRLQTFQRFIEYVLKNQQQLNRNIPTKSYFYKVWKSDCPDIRTRRHHGFAVCSRCEMLRSDLKANQGNTERTNAISRQLRAHINMMRAEREGYKRRCELAIQNPRKYCSIILDGADQKNYGLPHFMNSTKSDKGHKLKVKCVGVLEHRKEKKLTLFPMTEEFQTGANHVIEAAHLTLDQRAKDSGGVLPEILFVQADNCTRENKNKYFMAYFEMLVALGVFETVEISFLPVGHTHTDIDQAFSAVSRRLRFVDSVTMADLISELKRCYSPKASAKQIFKVANFSGLCEKVNCLNAVKNFSKFRYFRFSRRERDEDEASFYSTECHVKIQSVEAWSSLESVARFKGFLKSVPDLSLTPPTETSPPDNVTELNKCLNSMEERIRNSEKMNQLKALRDRVYSRRVDCFHWNLQECFEMNGCYSKQRNGTSVTWKNEGDDDSSAEDLDYAVNSFVAVKTSRTDLSKFWIALVLDVSERNALNQLNMLMIRWFSSRGESSDEFTSSYEPSLVFDPQKRRHVPFHDEIETSTVLVYFSSLTSQGFLRESTRNAIRQTLDLN